MSKWVDWLTAAFAKNTKLTMAQQQRLASWRKLPQPALEHSFTQSRYVVVDVETTGLNLLQDRLISIGAVAVVGGRILLEDSFSAVLQQREASSKENILVHGISGSKQREGLPPEEVLLAFLEFVDLSPLVAFHVEFDETMVRRAMRTYLKFNFKHPWLDLAYVMPALEPAKAAKCRSLDDWVDTFGIRIDMRHDALADALATAQLLQVALALAGKRGEASFVALRDFEKAQRWVSRIT